MRNHNALLGQVKGVDGIKTGYTEASGYNLVSSVRRDERHIVAVVLGGTSNAARDARMRQLIEDHIPRASARGTVPQLIKVADQADECIDRIGPPPSTLGPDVASAGSVDAASTKIAAEGMLASKPQTQASKRQTRASKPVTITKRLRRHERRVTSNRAVSSDMR